MPQVITPLLVQETQNHSVLTNFTTEYLAYAFVNKVPFAYTASRWLHLNNLQREGCCEKLEGGFSKAFIITTDDGRCVVAKFLTSVAGPATFVTNSEVATITYCKTYVAVGGRDKFTYLCTKCNRMPKYQFQPSWTGAMI
ncbi:hypothetical protein GX50_02713 [[Emmonsia] crescens]|uniref:Uncharacterized protein n=1 Tax=[Emmonsia] crescens TaxID=73230 RepID=A0A2B7ZLE1_9EURO|nr:hypothetical protein GX50_02713 [Emmonsia crescens]